MGRILPIGHSPSKYNQDPYVKLHMVSKNGNISIIVGSIQKEFLTWHADRQLDAILLGFDEDKIIDCVWEYEDV